MGNYGNNWMCGIHCFAIIIKTKPIADIAFILVTKKREKDRIGQQ